MWVAPHDFDFKDKLNHVLSHSFKWILKSQIEKKKMLIILNNRIREMKIRDQIRI